MEACITAPPPPPRRHYIVVDTHKCPGGISLGFNTLEIQEQWTSQHTVLYSNMYPDLSK